MCLALSQLDLWMRNTLNDCVSFGLMGIHHAVIDSDTVQHHTSMQTPGVVIMSFALLDMFTDAKKKLENVLDHIADAHLETRGKRKVCMHILQSHPRCTLMKMNIMSLQAVTAKFVSQNIPITSCFLCCRCPHHQIRAPVFYDLMSKWTT